MKYFVYVDGMIGIETDYRFLSWCFGQIPNPVDKSAFDRCMIKIRIRVINDRAVISPDEIRADTGQFRFFYAEKNAMNLKYSRTVAKVFHNSYSAEIRDDTIFVTVGKNFYRFVQLRIMNIHSLKYTLFDLVTCMLLRRGFTPLYCAAVETEDQKAAVLMAPPNTGKSLTAARLCERHGLKMISEDLAITDGTLIWATPWTNSFRIKGKGGSRRSGATWTYAEHPVPIGTVILLERGASGLQSADDTFLKKVSILNRYYLWYPQSPAVGVLAYFNQDFSPNLLVSAEHDILQRMLNRSACMICREAQPMRYADSVIRQMEMSRSQTDEADSLSCDPK